MNEPDPIDRLEHDHSHVGALVDALRDALATGEHAEAQETLRLLRDDLFAHFAREEEGLFPWVVRELAELAPAVDAVVQAHDRVCGAISRLAHGVEHGADPEVLRSLFERFDQGYVAHAREELELLRELDARLTGTQRRAVSELLREL